MFSLSKVVAMKIITLVVLGIGNSLGKEFHSMLGQGAVIWTKVVVYVRAALIKRKSSPKNSVRTVSITGNGWWSICYFCKMV